MSVALTFKTAHRSGDEKFDAYSGVSNDDVRGQLGSSERQHDVVGRNQGRALHHPHLTSVRHSSCRQLLYNLGLTRPFQVRTVYHASA